MKNKKLEYRMIGLVPFSLSPIQQGIQFGHGVVEYMNKHKTKKTKKWSKKDKTFIILNGGTTNKNINNPGSLNIRLEELQNRGIKFSVFYEPDLGDQLTSINFLVDERVYDKIKYPDFDEEHDMNGAAYESWVMKIGGSRNMFLREFLKQFRLA